MRSPANCLRRSPTRRVIRSRCSSSTCDLDTDLGIDSIKRVEIFSAIQDKLPGARAAGPEEIGTLGTLCEIVSFLGRASGGRGEVESQAESDGAFGFAGSSAQSRVLLESVAEKTGFPIDMLDLDMQLDVDLGIDSIKRVEIFSAVQDRLAGGARVGPGAAWLIAHASPDCRVPVETVGRKGRGRGGEARGFCARSIPRRQRSSDPIVAMRSRCERAERSGSRTTAHRLSRAIERRSDRARVRREGRWASIVARPPARARAPLRLDRAGSARARRIRA